jgi:hypothetical protein
MLLQHSSKWKESYVEPLLDQYTLTIAAAWLMNSCFTKFTFIEFCCIRTVSEINLIFMSTSSLVESEYFYTHRVLFPDSNLFSFNLRPPLSRKNHVEYELCMMFIEDSYRLYFESHLFKREQNRYIFIVNRCKKCELTFPYFLCCYRANFFLT